MGLLDFLQSASNTAASNVSAPVDGLAWLLRKAGMPIPDAPIGGSDWMERQGLTRPVKQSGASLAGETMGLLAPMAAAAKAPQIARGLLQMGENAAIPRTMNPQTGAVVWHGSPHKFDKFDSSKIGTGEGAQAYGHGLYLAESPDVAKSYTGRGTVTGGAKAEARLAKRLELAQDAGRYGEAMALEDLLVNFSPAKAASKFTVENGYTPDRVLEAQRVIKELGPKFKETGLYKVDLPDEHIAKMLDWDKPLSQQAPEVQAAFNVKQRDFVTEESLFAKAKQLGVSPTSLPEYAQLEAAMDSARPFTQTSGESAYRDLVSSLGMKKIGGQGAALTAHPDQIRSLGAKDATDFLSQAGIPGIRYLDGGSRGAGTGTSNYVVFPGNEDILKILERNGQGLLGP